MSNKSARRPRDGHRVTSYDVAELAGVSQSAVSRCFSAGASISADTRRKVEQAAHRLGYRPNAIARSLITRRTGLLGLVVTDNTLKFSPAIVHDLCDALRAADFMALLTTLTDERDLGAFLPRILAYRPEAIVSLASIDRQLATAAARERVPFVLVNRTPPAGMRTASVGCGHAEAVHALARRLIAGGARRLAFLAGPRPAPVSMHRLEGFQHAMREAGLAPQWVEHADYSYDGGRRIALSILRKGRHPDAVMCANDAMAIGMLDACRHDLGFDVPGDISITGFDDIAESGHPTRSLTTIRQPTARIASAVTQALEVLTKRTPGASPRPVELPGEIIVRASARLA